MITHARNSLLGALLALAVLAPTVHPQSTTVAEQTLLRSDSIVFGAPTVSPNGRWLVVTGSTESDRENLYIAAMPDGELRPLTRGRVDDDFPRWAPDGRTLYFLSNRLEEQANQVFRIPFDPETGEATGLPRPVSLEHAVGRSPVPSPDGTRLAFGTRRSTSGERHLVVVPSTGGVPTVVTDRYDGGAIGWTPDGRSLLFIGGDPSSEGNVVYRVPAEGGEPHVHLRSDLDLRDVSTDGRRYLWRHQSGFGDEIRLTDTGGSILATFEPSEGVGFWPRLSADGRSILVDRWDGESPVVVAPVTGGAGRSFGDPGAWHYPLGFSRDGRVLMSADGGSILFDPASEYQRTIEIDGPGGPGINERLHPDGSHVLFSRDPRPDADRVELWIHDIETGNERRVSQGFPRLSQGSGTGRVTGRGGRSMLDGDRFLFLEHESTGVHVRAVTPDGPVETLTVLPARPPTETRVAVHGSRVAWIEEGPGSDGEASWALHVRHTESGDERVVLESDEQIFVPVWSNDGRRMAVAHHRDGAVDDDLGIIDLDHPAPSVEIRDAGATWWWTPEWTADDARVIVTGMSGSPADYEVWMIQVENGETPPVPLTGDPSASTYEFELSYDGRQIAYHLERPSSSEILRYTIGG